MRKGTVMPGRILVKLKADVSSISGVRLANDRKNDFGEVMQVGPPDPDIHTWWEMTKWSLFGIHPIPMKVGNSVLMPHMKGRTFHDDDGVWVVLWVQDIAYYE